MPRIQVHGPMCRAGFAIIGCTALTFVIGCQGVNGGKLAPLKHYINLDLPGESCFTPTVLTFDREVIVARVAYVDHRRDIQVLARCDDRWEFVGRQGRAVTGTDGCFLTDAVRDVDGKVWVLVGYTQPSNAQRGGSYYLYCLDQAEWKVAGPPNKTAKYPDAHRGLHFLGRSGPIFHFQRSEGRGRQRRPTDHLVWLERGEWTSPPAQRILSEHCGHLCWRESDAWFFVPTITDGHTTLDVFWLKGPRSEDIVGPIRLGTWNGEFTFMHFAVSGRQEIAVFASKGEDRWFHAAKKAGHLLRLDASNHVIGDVLPVPPVRDFENVQWSPKGKLFCTSQSDDQQVAVFELTEKGWVKAAQRRQPSDQGLIFNPRLYFGVKGEPIVVWEDFFPK